MGNHELQAANRPGETGESPPLAAPPAALPDGGGGRPETICLDDVVFYSLLTAALILAVQILEASRGPSAQTGLLIKSLIACGCGFLAGRGARNAPLAMGFLVGVFSSVLYETSMVVALIAERFFASPGFFHHLLFSVIAVILAALAGSAGAWVLTGRSTQ